MKAGRVLLLVVLLIVVAGASWFYFSHRQPAPAAHLVVYYTKVDGRSLGTWTVSMRPQQTGESGPEHIHNEATIAAVQAVAGPPSDVQAVRFPAGTRVNGVTVNGTVATVDLSNEVTNQGGGSFGENGEFKGLVYTLTGIPDVDAVQVTIAGHKLQTLPGGHLELDTPLRRSDW